MHRRTGFTPARMGVNIGLPTTKDTKKLGSETLYPIVQPSVVEANGRPASQAEAWEPALKGRYDGSLWHFVRHGLG